MFGPPDLIQAASAAVTPASLTGNASAAPPGVVPAGVGPTPVPLPRMRPSRVVQTNDTGGGNVGGNPISIEPVTPADSSGGSSSSTDPYAGVPRIQPRAGFRRYAYNAMSGIGAVPANADPISAFADAYTGAQNAEQSQTAAARTAQIDEINRKLEMQKVANESARNARLDAAKIAEENANADLHRAQAGTVGDKGTTLTENEYQTLLIKRELRLQSAEGLGPNSILNEDQVKAAQARIKVAMDAYKKELEPRRAGAKPTADQPNVLDMRPKGGNANVLDLRKKTTAPGDVPDVVTNGFNGDAAPAAAKTRGIEPPASSGAIPDNISGDGSLKDPYRVKNPKDPTLKAKIKVGDHFIYLNPQTGKEEIRIRDR